jgi:hypothetical protein
MTARSTEAVVQRGADRSGPGAAPRAARIVGHPLAFAATALVLLALFGATFVAHPERLAPTKDPAYYTWRTEALLSEEPVALLEIRGAFDMFAGGYRVAAPTIGGLLRDIPGVSSLHSTTLLMVVVPVSTALLLAGFAYRQRRDPLIFHAVAFGAAGLYLTPPFVGYLDNILCLFFLAAAVWFISEARVSWSARAGLLLFGVASGFTHPTTFAIFCLTLGAMAAARFVWRGFALGSTWRDDGAMLVTAGVATVLTYVAWKVGIWGRPASLGEAALPPPYGAGFFIDRMVEWAADMRPVLNGPLFAIGIVALLAPGRRWVEDDLARVGVVWLLPLVGLFGFLAGATYPYYRFFNTTLAWVLLVGVGAYVLARALLDRARSRGPRWLAWVGIAAIALVFATNLQTGFDKVKWNDPGTGWMSASTRADLDALRSALATNERPVVFVIDDADASFQIWGFTKLSGNTSRYALPHGHIDDGYLYLGSLDNFLAGKPTLKGDKTYDKLSPALLADAEEGIEASGRAPIVVVASAFNTTGANAAVAAGRAPPPRSSAAAVVVVHDGRVAGAGRLADLSRLRSSPPLSAPSEPSHGPGALHIARVLGGLALLCLPGALAFRWFVRDGTFAEALGMVPALSVALLALAGIGVLAVARSPFSGGLVWTALAGAVGAGILAWLRSRGAPTPT